MFVKHDPTDIDFAGADMHDVPLNGTKFNLVPDVAGLSLTGIDPSGIAWGGSEIVLMNCSTTESVTIPHNNAGSAPDNRFYTASGMDVVLGPGEMRWAVRNEHPGLPTGWRVET